MTRNNRIRFGIIFLIIILIGGLGWLSAYYADLPQNLSQHETILLGQNHLVPGSQAAMRVAVRDSRDGAPLADAELEISLQPADGGRAELVYTGQTGAQGTADVSFAVPDTPQRDYNLIVETRSRLGSDRMEQAVTLERDHRILLSSDKPLYQPGQVIHLRALALSTFDLTPAARQPLELSIADGKGNTVFRDTLTTSEYGVASADFQLAGEVNTGPYKISAQLGNTSSEKTVTVERYVLPQFDITIDTEQAYYHPGQTVRGTLSAEYFFGKPVAESEVTLEGFTFDVTRQDEFNSQGRTDAEGVYQFEFDLPDYVVGSDLESGLGTFYLQASVIDQTNHSEQKGTSFPLAQQPLIIEAIPEGGQFRPGVENLFYVLTSYPDGSPAQTRLRVNFSNMGQTVSAESGPYGLTTIPVTPDTPWQEVTITTSDPAGHEASRSFFFEESVGTGTESILLRPDRPAYRVGETMELTILTSAQSGTVYLDVVREGQTVSTRAVEITEGETAVAIDVTPELFGTLQLHAYKILRDGTITRDTRLVLVERADDLEVAFNTDKEEYQPGETAVLDVTTSGEDGNGTQSAIGLAIVDEAVFALAEQDPGFAKLYFMLEEELLQPKYELHGFSVPDLIGKPQPVDDPALRQAQEGAAQASLAEVAPRQTAFTLSANSREENMAQARQQRADFFTSFSQVIFSLMLLIPLGVVGVTAVHLWRKRHFWRTLGVAVLVTIGFALLVMVGAVEAFFDWLNWEGESILLSLLLLGLISALGLALYAWRRQDRAMGWALGLIVLFVPLLLAGGWASQWATYEPSDNLLRAAPILITLIPFAFFMRAAGFGLEKRRLLAAAATFTALFLLVLPAVGLATAPMGRTFSRTTAGLGGPMVVEEAVMDMAVEVEEEGEMMAATGAEDAAQNQADGGEPRLRQFFPETMFWLPDGVSDENGTLTVDVPVADSITTWRLTALASTQDGRLGSATGSLRVFQPFFLNLDLPQALTVGDEIAVPVGVFNYLPQAQTVRLEVQPEPWFELQDEASKEIEIASEEITVVTFRIRALDFGRQSFQVTAYGSEMSDAIRKQVQVYPDGKEIRFSQSDRLQPGATRQQTIAIPADAIPGTQDLTVKVYPGMVSQVVEGLDSILRMPNGCFEQTSSTTYPNVLVLDYLQTSDQVSPEVQFKAEDYINIGYQRLTTFEVDGGGFSLFGDPPASPLLSAYGVQEFSDMSQVYNVDPALISRTAEWLLSQQNGDGSWGDESWVEGTFVSGPQDDPLVTTAYVLWSLGRAGYGRDGRFQSGLSYLAQRQSEVEDAYTLALIANAFVAGGETGSTTQTILNRLADMAQVEGDTASWPSAGETFMGSYGEAGALETTALATLAFIHDGSHTDLANKGLLYLVQNKDSFGNWQTTQATILSLQAFIASAKLGSQDVNAEVTITLNGGQQRTVQVTPENFDVVQMVTFDDVRLGENTVDIQVAGQGKLMYQVAGSFYLPWQKLADYPDVAEPQDLVDIDVAYDRTELQVDDTVMVDVTVRMNEEGSRADWALVDLGVPPGFSVNTEDLSAQVAQFEEVSSDYTGATIERYEMTGRQVLVYIGNLSAAQPLSFSYRMTAKYPLRAQTPASNAYDYYNPAVSGQETPQLLTVQEEG